MENCSRGSHSVATLRLRKNHANNWQSNTDCSETTHGICRRDASTSPSALQEGRPTGKRLQSHSTRFKPSRHFSRNRRPEQNPSHLRTPTPRRSLRSRANEAEIPPAAVQTGGIKVALWLREALGTRGFNPCRSLK